MTGVPIGTTRETEGKNSTDSAGFGLKEMYPIIGGRGTRIKTLTVTKSPQWGPPGKYLHIPLT